MKVVLSTLALAELDDILAYVAQHNVDAAAKLRAFMFLALQRISRYPEAAQKIAARPNVRRLSLVRYPYALYYEVGIESIIIVRILHTSRHPLKG